MNESKSTTRICLPTLNYYSNCCNFSLVFLSTYDKAYYAPAGPDWFFGLTKIDTSIAPAVITIGQFHVYRSGGAGPGQILGLTSDRCSVMHCTYQHRMWSVLQTASIKQ